MSPILDDDALLDLIARARAGDQNAMALISATRRSAREGGELAQRSLARILMLIEAHPVRPRRVLSDEVEGFDRFAGEGAGLWSGGGSPYQRHSQRARFYSSNDCAPYLDRSGSDSFYPETFDVERSSVPAPNDRTQIERAGLHGYRNETFGADGHSARPAQAMAPEALQGCAPLRHATGFELLSALSRISPMAEPVAVVLVAHGPPIGHDFLRALIARSGSSGGRMLAAGILGNLPTTTCAIPSDWPYLRAGHLLGRAERLQRVIRGGPISLVSELAASELEPERAAGEAARRAMARADREGLLAA